jgi:hypothetical protein
MSEDIVPEHIRAFVARHVDSVAQLEALLLLRSHPMEKWDVSTLARRLYIGEEEMLALLAHLRADDFVRVSEGIYHYECATEEKRRAVDAVADFYSRHLIPVTHLIHSKPRRIRQFADAFRLKRDR